MRAPVDHLVEKLEKIGSTALTDAKPFDHSNVLIEHSNRKASRRLSIGMQETVQSMGSAVRNLQKAEDGEEAIQFEETVLNKKQRLEKGSEMSGAGGCLLVPESAVESYREQGDGAVSRNLVWSGSG